ncbi:MAG: division/cell wall cluster transcriptional repressor MraZ [Planctomycetota bacterium]
MLFTGEYEHTIDAKQRLAIPAEIRSRLDPDLHGDGFYLAMGSNGALWLWPARTFEEIVGALDPSLLPEEELMEFEELVFSQAARVELDKAGRIRIPERLLAAGELGQAVTVLGVKDHLELRDTDQWRLRRAEKIARQGEIMLRARRALADQRSQRTERSP